MTSLHPTQTMHALEAAAPLEHANLFQLVTLPLLGLLFLREVVLLFRSMGSRRAALFRAAVLLAAVVTIQDPDRLMRLARAIGIGRGTDLLLYVFVLASIGVSFAFYARMARLQRQITELVRHIAIQEARSEGRE